jgi:hypothetical protein
MNWGSPRRSSGPKTLAPEFYGYSGLLASSQNYPVMSICYELTGAIGTCSAAAENHGFAAQGRVLTDEYPLA